MGAVPLGNVEDTAAKLDRWSERVCALEAVLGRAGRHDLLAGLSHVRELLSVIAENPVEAEAAFALLGRALLDLKACVLERGRPLDPAVWGEIERTCAPADDAPSGEWVASVLDGLGAADDDELGAFAESVSRTKKHEPRDELGTLREPLASSRSNLVAASAATPRVLMKGELSAGLLADLIQLFAQNAETGLLVIEARGGNASIYFRGGAVIDAEHGGDVGEKAFFRTMAIREGRFSYQRGVETDGIRIHRTAQHLIMESLRLMDEGA